MKVVKAIFCLGLAFFFCFSGVCSAASLDSASEDAVKKGMAKGFRSWAGNTYDLKSAKNLKVIAVREDSRMFDSRELSVWITYDAVIIPREDYNYSAAGFSKTYKKGEQIKVIVWAFAIVKVEKKSSECDFAMMEVFPLDNPNTKKRLKFMIEGSKSSSKS